jgi:proteic killer suppression protein
MIKSFKDKETERLYVAGKSRRFPDSLCAAGVRRLDYLNAAVRFDDLKSPPGNRLEVLKGNFRGKYSIRISDQFRIVFRFEEHDAYDVEIADYHK